MCVFENKIAKIIHFLLRFAISRSRSIGVSNFGVHHLKGLMAAGCPKPVVNQIELHPWQQKRDIVQFCQEQGIAVMGYSPLAKAQHLHDKTLLDLAKK